MKQAHNDNDTTNFLEWLRIPGVAWIMGGYWAACLVTILTISLTK